MDDCTIDELVAVLGVPEDAILALLDEELVKVYRRPIDKCFMFTPDQANRVAKYFGRDLAALQRKQAVKELDPLWMRIAATQRKQWHKR